MQKLIAKLRERNVPQYVLLYSGFVWGFIQMVDFMSEKFDWPVSLVKVLTIVGFSSIPSALIFYYYIAQPNSLKKQAPFYIGNLIIIIFLIIYTSPFAWKVSDVKIDFSTEQSIAVLPFVNMSNDPEQEYFSDGLSEELLTLLSKIPELKVIGRTSSFSFKGKNEDLRIIGEKLGVANILEGSVRKEPNCFMRGSR